MSRETALSAEQTALSHAPAFWAVVPAAGVGRRFGGDPCDANKPKQYQALLGKSVAQWTFQRLLSVERIAGCVVALGAEDTYWSEQGVKSPRLSFTTGGAERADTVRLALQSLQGRAHPNDWVLVHDIARPCVRSEDIERLMDELGEHPVGGILAAPMADTVKCVTADRRIEATADRNQLWSALTPQMFRYGLLQQALERALKVGFQPTDEASAVEQLGHQPVVVAGQRDNIKITRREDLAMAEAILQVQLQQREAES